MGIRVDSMSESAKKLWMEHSRTIIIIAVIIVIIIFVMLFVSRNKITSQIAYVKMDINNENLLNRHLHLREVEFYDENNLRIMPVSCDVSTSQIGSPDVNCKAMQDGNSLTYWHSKYSAAGPSVEGGNTHFVKFVLPNDQLLKTMVVVSRYNNTSRYGMAYVEYEVNGEIQKKYASLEGELIKSGSPDEGNTFRYVF